MPCEVLYRSFAFRAGVCRCIAWGWRGRVCLSDGEERPVVPINVPCAWQSGRACRGEVLWVTAYPSLRLLPPPGSAWTFRQLYGDGQCGVICVVEGHERGVGFVGCDVWVVR